MANYEKVIGKSKLTTQLYRPNDVFEKKRATNKFNIFY